MMESRDRVQWIYSSRGNQELSERYDQWAKDYDADLDEEFGWLGPKRAVEVFAVGCQRNWTVLEAEQPEEIGDGRGSFRG